MITLSFWDEVDSRLSRWDVTAHPFYRRWAGGELTADELAAYVSEYEHTVVATGTAWRRVADLDGGGFESEAAAAEADLRRWHRFAKHAGWGGRSAWLYAEDPLPTTVECAETWAGGEGKSLVEHLVSLYAIEGLCTTVSRVKLAGALEHYGFVDGEATEYFWGNVGFAADRKVRRAVEGYALGADPDALLDQVDEVLRAYWSLLDGVAALAVTG